MSGNSGSIIDIQWHRADFAFDIENLIWDGTYTRYIFNAKPRAFQFVGEWVCKYGMSSGYGCGMISTTNQDGINIRVNGVTLIEGDSGGPWFWNNTAYGTTISYIEHQDGTRDAIYGPVDNIYSLGLQILPREFYYLPQITLQ